MSPAFLQWDSFSAHYRQHNAALKWFRMLTEKDRMPVSDQTSHRLEPQCLIGQIDHQKGVDYSFDLEAKVPWSWMEMVAQMTDESIEYVCQGPSGRSGGLMHAEFSVRPGSYDHKRHHADYRRGQPDRSRGQTDRAGRSGEPAAVMWDFALHRADGSVLRVHPQWKGTKIESMEMPPGAEYPEMQPPRKGVGRSDGRGTFSHYKNFNVSSDKLRFDPNKRLDPMKQPAVEPQSRQDPGASTPPGGVPCGMPPPPPPPPPPPSRPPLPPPPPPPAD